MPSASQHVRVLPGRFVLSRARGVDSVVTGGDVLAAVFGPDGGGVMRRIDTAAAAGGESWVALWNGDDAHDPEATGMLSAIVAPLAAGGIAVWTAASYDGDLVLVPTRRWDDAVEILRRAGHRVSGPDGAGQGTSDGVRE